MTARQESTESKRGWYRKRSKPVDVLHYTGGFPLDFLRSDEQVSAAGDRNPDGGCYIESPARLAVYVQLGYVLVRETNGTLTTFPSVEQFDAAYEPAAEVQS